MLERLQREMEGSELSGGATRWLRGVADGLRDHQRVAIGIGHAELTRGQVVGITDLTRGDAGIEQRRPQPCEVRGVR